MSGLLSIHGSAFTRDVDYSAFRGRLVGQYTVERHDERRNCTIRTTYEVIDIGRADPLPPADPDAQLGIEPWEADSEPFVTAVRGKKDALAERDGLLMASVKAHLADYGESSVRIIAENVGASSNAVTNHLRKHTGVYVYLGGPRGLWGLVGVEYGLSPSLPQYVYVFRAALQKHGPMTVAELCRVTGIMRGSATVGMARFTDIFVKVGHATRGRMMAAIWGLVGVHDQPTEEGADN